MQESNINLIDGYDFWPWINGHPISFKYSLEKLRAERLRKQRRRNNNGISKERACIR